VLSRPKLPNIPGIERFKGHSFHTSRWDYAYTGGDETGNMTGLADKRVAIIGTGATAVQIIPYLAQSAKEVFVFQRTPCTVDVRNNRPTDPEWYASLEPGWQKRRRENFVRVMMGMSDEASEVGDYWTDMAEQIQRWLKAPPEGLPATDVGTVSQYADYKKMNEIRARIDEVVRDPATAEALKPWYNLWCKRPCYSDEYLPAFNSPNLTLIDTRGEGVDEITETGVLHDGKAYDAGAAGANWRTSGRTVSIRCTALTRRAFPTSSS
jgi:cyclohexanone monooxygenase